MSLWNSFIAQEIRTSILDGTFRYCNVKTCPYFGSGKLPLQKYVVGDPYEEIIHDKRTKMDSMKLWLSFDHHCNIRCISCRNSLVQLSEKEKTENQELMELVKRDLDSVTTVGISGQGEPFASPVIRDFLFNFDSAGHQNLKLCILSNGQLLTRECWEKMEKAHPAIASVQISIDAATKETYERTRLGGSFETLIENLHYLSKLRTLNAFGELIISFVVNARNFTEMKEFVKMGFELNCDYVYFAFMSNWGVFTNEEYRRMAVHRPGHEKNGELNEVLADPLFNDTRIFMRTASGFTRNDILREPIFL
jgi:MoaA/NifB/PqqE/SkfB family radical SAM enzyme